MGRKNRTKSNKGGYNTFVTNVLTAFGKNPYRALNYKQVAHLLNVKDKAGKDLISKVLLELLDQGELEQIRTGKYKLTPKAMQEYSHVRTVVTGTVDMKQTGKAYVIADEGGDDIFIASNNTNRAMHGDTVKVNLFPKRNNRKLEGQITEVLERKMVQFVGVIEKSEYFTYFVPDSNNAPVDFLIPKDRLNNAEDGQKVKVKFVDWPEQAKNPIGEVIEILGYPGDNDVEMQSILANNDLPYHFGPGVEKEADKIDDFISGEEIAKRQDFREIFTITIDPKDAKDFDDAISFRVLEEGRYEVGVHIADVSHYVKPGSLIDQEAYMRATSVYLVDRVVPMLPEILSNKVCSLRPNEEKLCFSAVFEMNDQAEILDQWIGRTVINSDRRFTYEEAQEIIETQKGDHADAILKLYHLSAHLRDKRFKNGSINFHSQEVRFELDEKSKPIGVYIKEQKEANWLIEDFMLLANKKIAERIGILKGKQKPRTFVYRIHDEPDPEKLNTFVRFVGKLGYQIKMNSPKTLARSFNKLFENIAGKGEEHMIETIAIRTMAKAEYSTDNIGHYGLSFPHYTHFTSPIRRYPDLMVHRLLEHYLDGKQSVNKEEIEDMCLHCSQMERKAIDAERESVKYKQAEYLVDKVGKTFPGIISGISKWGIFIELEGNKCEGMVRFKDMKDDFYYLDEKNYQIIGQMNNEAYKLGDRVYIVVKRIELSKKQMDFELVQ